jgi:hypothetical protein
MFSEICYKPRPFSSARHTLVSKLALTSIVLIAVGLVLFVISDPLLRAVTGSGGFAPGTGTGTFIGNFTRGNFTSGQFTTFRRGGAALIGTTAYESLAGIALVGAGLLLEIFSLFIRASPAKPAT